jgi:hypothetical protein
MAIHRAPRPANHFTQIRNDVLRDDRLSYRSRGVLAFILSNADGWSITSESLARDNSGEGRDGIRTTLAELEAAGYLVRTRVQDERGRWSTQSVIHDTPQVTEQAALFDVNAQVTPKTDEPAPGEPTPGQPTPVEPSSKKNTDDEQPPTGGEQKPADPGKEVATTLYDHAGGMVNFIAMRGIALRALKAKGATVESVAAIMCQLYDDGKPITLQTVGQAMNRAGSFRDTNADHWANGGGF